MYAYGFSLLIPGLHNYKRIYQLVTASLFQMLVDSG